MDRPEPNMYPFPDGSSTRAGDTRGSSPSSPEAHGGSAATRAPSSAQGQGIAGQARQTASDVAEQAREQVASKVSAQKDRATGELGHVASALRQTSTQLRSQGQGAVPKYVEQAADQVERVTQYLQSKSVGELVGEVERFARREPALFLGGAFALGLLGARFLKSSSPSAGSSSPRLPPPEEPLTPSPTATPGFGTRGRGGLGGL